MIAKVRNVYRDVTLMRSLNPSYDWKYVLDGVIYWIKLQDVQELKFLKMEDFEI